MVQSERCFGGDRLSPRRIAGVLLVGDTSIAGRGSSDRSCSSLVDDICIMVHGLQTAGVVLPWAIPVLDDGELCALFQNCADLISWNIFE